MYTCDLMHQYWCIPAKWTLEQALPSLKPCCLSGWFWVLQGGPLIPYLVTLRSALLLNEWHMGPLRCGSWHWSENIPQLKFHSSFRTHQCLPLPDKVSTKQVWKGETEPGRSCQCKGWGKHRKGQIAITQDVLWLLVGCKAVATAWPNTVHDPKVLQASVYLWATCLPFFGGFQALPGVRSYDPTIFWELPSLVHPHSFTPLTH